MHDHYKKPPFTLLPSSVVDSIYERLSTLSLYQCSLVCKAWRHLPYSYLYQLSVGEYGLKLPPELVHICSHLRAIYVSSSSSTRWPDLAQQLTRQQLTSLQELHIQHSSYRTSEDLQQLKRILQVQGPQCRLYLAVTDKASLQTLLDHLPMQGLVQLDLNGPYLPKGAAELLVQAAALQHTLSAGQQPLQDQQLIPSSRMVLQQNNKSNQHTQHSEQQGYAQQPQQQQRGQQPLSIGVWVCCWGGCSGLDLQSALNSYQQLKAVNCQMHGCESINCCSSGDVHQLYAFKGLKALGFNYKASSKTNGGYSNAATTREPSRLQHTASVLLDSDAVPALSSRGAPLDENTAALGALASLQDTLQHLTIHGCPVGGFRDTSTPAAARRTTLASSSAPYPGQPAVTALHPLAALTGLTKLSLLKQWGTQPALPIHPISQLTLLRELAIERQGLSNPHELTCLSVLTQLKVLSLSLAVEAEQLVEDLKEGKWQAVCAEAGRVRGDQLGTGVDKYQYQHQQDQQQLGGQDISCAADGQLVDDLAQLTVAGAASVQEASQQQLVRSHSGDHAASANRVCTSVDVCNCFCGMNHNSDQEIAAADGAPASEQHALRVVYCTPDTATAAATTTPFQLLQHLGSCCCAPFETPALMDWGWLLHLTQLETAWLQVPHLDLACLPSSLVEFDAQQPHDLTPVSITCRGPSSNLCTSNVVWLPNLKRLVLPSTLQVQPVPQIAAAAAAADPDSAIDGAGLPAQAAQARVESVSSASLAAASDSAECVSVSEFSEDWDGNSSDGSDKAHANSLMQLHQNATLLLQLSLGCPELRQLELVQWQLPARAVLAAVQHMRYLKTVSIAPPDDDWASDMLGQGVEAVRGGAVKLEVQAKLVHARYPWSSVLDQR